MNTSIKSLLVFALVSVASVIAMADGKPFQASLTPDIALYDSSQQINGLTLSIWGENPQTSVAFGFVNGTSGDSAGVSFGLLNYGNSYKGAQFATVNYDKMLHGVQFGFLNYAKATKTGIQLGFINVIPENTKWFSDFPKSIAPFMIFINWRLED